MSHKMFVVYITFIVNPFYKIIILTLIYLYNYEENILNKSYVN